MYVCVAAIVVMCLFVAICSAQNNGDLRLAGTGATATQGRLEVFLNDKWGTVEYNSDSTYGMKMGDAACSQLGYNGASLVLQANDTFGQGSGPVWMVDVYCSEGCNHLQRCVYDTPTGTPDHSQDVGVYCIYEPVWEWPGNGYIRITNYRTGNYSSAGVVEVYFENSYYALWGTVCSDNFYKGDADTVCRQLGYTGSVGFTSVHVSPLNISYEWPWLNDLHCSTGHRCFYSCYDYPRYYNATCLSGEVVTVNCTFNKADAHYLYGTNIDCVTVYDLHYIPYWGYALIGIGLLTCCVVVAVVLVCCFTLASCPLAASRRRYHYKELN